MPNPVLESDRFVYENLNFRPGRIEFSESADTIIEREEGLADDVIISSSFPREYRPTEYERIPVNERELSEW